MLSSVASILAGGVGIANTLITDAVAQKYVKAKQDRLAEYEDILNQPDCAERRARLADYFLQLTTECGTPARGGMGIDTAVPVDVLQALVTIACAKLYEDQMLAEVTGKLAK